MIFRIINVFFLLALITGAPPAYSCTKTTLLDMDSYIEGSEGIFIGKLANDNPTVTSNPYWVRNRYRVIGVLKGSFRPGRVIELNERLPRRFHVPDPAVPEQELVTVYRVENEYSDEGTDAFFRKDYHQTQCEKFNFSYEDLMKRLQEDRLKQ